MSSTTAKSALPAAFTLSESFTTNPAASGYVFNHTMLRVKDIDQSLKFYRDLLGMSVLTKMDLGPFAAYHLVHQPEDAKVPADVLQSLSSRRGILELIHVPGAPDVEYGGDQGKISFGHLAFGVPDVGTAIKRAEEAGWKVAKHLGDVSIDIMKLPKSVAQVKEDESFAMFFGQVGFILDPDK